MLNPPFSQLFLVLTKSALEGARLVLCTPDWGTTGEHAHWVLKETIAENRGLTLLDIKKRS